MLYRCLLLVAVLGVLVAIPVLGLGRQTLAADEQETLFDFLTVDINILANSDMEITETQKYSFFGGTFYYGYRWIPLDEVESIDKIEVYEDGRPYPRDPVVRRWIDTYRKTGELPTDSTYAYCTWTEGDRLWIGWWYPETTGGSRTFVVKYVVHGGLRIDDRGDQLYWKAVFGDRDMPINSAVVTVHLPEPVSSTQLGINSYGVPAQSTIIDDSTIEFTAGPVPGNGELSIRVIFPHGIVAAPSSSQGAGGIIQWVDETAEKATQWLDQNPTVMSIINWCLAGMGAAFIIGGGLWFLAIRRSRAAEPKAHPPMTYITTPPDDLPPALAGRLANGAYGFLGDIFYLAQRGFLTVTEQFEKRWYGYKQDFLLERGEQDPPYSYQVHLMDLLFRGRSGLYLSKHKNFLPMTTEQAREALDSDGIRLGLLERVDKETVRATGRGANILNKTALLCLILGIVTLGLSILTQADWAVHFASGTMLVFAVAAWHMTIVPARVKRTEEGARVATRWQAYRYYLLLITRKGQGLIENPNDLYRDLPYAVRFGLGKKLVRTFTTLDEPAPAPSWYYPQLMPADSGRSMSTGAATLSLLGIRDGFYRMLRDIRRELPSMGKVGPAPVMVPVAAARGQVEKNRMARNERQRRRKTRGDPLP